MDENFFLYIIIICTNMWLWMVAWKSDRTGLVAFLRNQNSLLSSFLNWSSSVLSVDKSISQIFSGAERWDGKLARSMLKGLPIQSSFFMSSLDGKYSLKLLISSAKCFLMLIKTTLLSFQILFHIRQWTLQT